MHQFTSFISGIWVQVPHWAQYLLITVGEIVAVAIPVILTVAYLTYFERKVIGYMQSRIGPNRVGPAGCCSRLPT